jgi:hypothetical protein
MSVWPLSMDIIILSGYIIFSSCLNVMALLISAFYQKRLHQPSPKLVFIISISLSLLFIISIILENMGIAQLQITSSLLLTGSSFSSAVGILNLFFCMRKTKNR